MNRIDNAHMCIPKDAISDGAGKAENDKQSTGSEGLAQALNDNSIKSLTSSYDLPGGSSGADQSGADGIGNMLNDFISKLNDLLASLMGKTNASNVGDDSSSQVSGDTGQSMANVSDAANAESAQQSQAATDPVTAVWIDLYNKAEDGSGMKTHVAATLKAMGVDVSALDNAAGSGETTNPPVTDETPTTDPTTENPPATSDDTPATDDTPPATDDTPPTDPTTQDPPATSNDNIQGVSGSSQGFSTQMPQGKLSSQESDQMALQVMDGLIQDLGLTPEQAAGVVGNLTHESAGMNPHVNEFNWVYPEGDDRNYGEPFDNPYGYGWAQWSGSRKTDFINFAKQNGLDPGSPAANYAFLLQELNTTESATVPALKAATTAEDATIAFRQVFERAAMPNDSGRLDAANKYLEMYNSQVA